MSGLAWKSKLTLCGSDDEADVAVTKKTWPKWGPLQGADLRPLKLDDCSQGKTCLICSGTVKCRCDPKVQSWVQQAVLANLAATLANLMYHDPLDGGPVPWLRVHNRTQGEQTYQVATCWFCCNFLHLVSGKSQLAKRPASDLSIHKLQVGQLKTHVWNHHIKAAAPQHKEALDDYKLRAAK